MNIPELLKELTLEEKAQLLCGYKTMGTYSVERLNIPSLTFSDGPHGVRAEEPDGDSMSGIFRSLPATCFPAAGTTANSWSRDLLNKMGKALGEECRNYGIHTLLGPAVNIKRNPLAGRNFEYFSEDPLVAGVLGAALASGVESTGVGTSIKHFAANNSENFRFSGNSVVDSRVLREIYLKPFETIVKQAKPSTMMCAYNQINGTHCSENHWLLTDVLRKEWGFDGVVMTDWGAIKDREKGVDAGLDLEMPGMVKQNVSRIVDAVKNGELKTEALNKAAENMLRLIDKVYEPNSAPCDFESHAKLAADIATESAVLLKNENTLPLNRDKKYLVIGDLFRQMRYQGSGSSLINPAKLCTPEDAFKSRNIQYTFVRGYRESEVALESSYLEEAMQLAAESEQIIVFAGQTDYVESEGFDRESMRLPENQIALLEKLSALGKPITLVLFGGSSIEMPFESGFSAILNMFLPGEMGGEATARLLFGESNPCGKLAETWVNRYEDVPFGSDFSKNPVELYKESLYVGYRYYLSAEKEVRYPFGYGLSYTTFKYDNLSVKEENGVYTATLKVKNTGRMAGTEIVQLYVSAPKNQVFAPLRELRGFERVYLDASEEKTVEITFKKDDLRFYNSKSSSWELEGGEYLVQVGASCVDIRLETSLTLNGDFTSYDYPEIYNSPKMISSLSDKDFETHIGYPIPKYEMGKRPYTMETTIGEFNTFIGGIFKKAVVGVGESQYKSACKMPDGPEKERKKKAGIFISKMMPSNTLRSLCFSSSGAMKYPIARGVLEMANGHIIRGILRMIGK